MATLDYGRSRLSELLKARRMSQSDFASDLGVSEGFVSQIISGYSKFTFLKARQASEILKCHTNDLYDWIETVDD